MQRRDRYDSSCPQAVAVQHDRNAAAVIQQSLITATQQVRGAIKHHSRCSPVAPQEEAEGKSLGQDVHILLCCGGV